jgi:hypothetical protein
MFGAARAGLLGRNRVKRYTRLNETGFCASTIASAPASFVLGHRNKVVGKGPLIGKVCHFVDTCVSIVGHCADGLKILTSTLDSEGLHSGQMVVALHYPDEPPATIAYARAGHPATPKEKVDVLGQDHTASILNYRSLMLDGKLRKLSTRDEGRVAPARTFLAASTRGVGVDETRSSAPESNKAILQLSEALCSA